MEVSRKGKEGWETQIATRVLGMAESMMSCINSSSLGKVMFCSYHTKQVKNKFIHPNIKPMRTS